MTIEEYNEFCRALPATTYVVQWRGAHVWKVGDKVFVIGRWQNDEPYFTFKVSDIAYEMLKALPGLRPAPHFASRGMKWIQHYAKPGLSRSGLRDYIRQSYIIVSRDLPKKRQIELGLVAGMPVARQVTPSDVPIAAGRPRGRLVPLHNDFDRLRRGWLQRGQESVIDQDGDAPRHPRSA